MNYLEASLVFIIYLVIAPLLGGLLTGIDRIITARMQRRVGPPLLQPFYDVLKLFQKQQTVVRRSQSTYIYFFMVFVVFTGGLFFTGGDFLLVIFSLTLAGIFFVLAGYKGSSPYSILGAERELLQMVAYEPMILLMAVSMYKLTGSFYVSDILSYPHSVIVNLPGIFIGILYILTIKLRKSPFDLSTSHHAHQEIVKGITTEFTGPDLALIEIAHWYETVLVLGMVYIFFATHPLLGVFAALFAFFLEILIDNSAARVRWQWMLFGSWIVALVMGMTNLWFLSMIVKG